MPSANTVAELAVVVSADTSAAEKGLTDLGTKVGNAGSALQTAFAGAAVAGIAGVAAGLTASVVAATDFEKSMSAVKAVSGSTSDEMSQLSGLALKLGADTSFSAKEAADGIGELAKAGVSVGDILGGGAKAALDLAAAGSLSVADAAGIAATAMTVFNKQGSELSGVADQIAGFANQTKGEVSDFSFSLSAVGTVAATVGLNFEDTATSIGLLGKAGILGSDAGTSLKTMLMNLVPATNKAGDMMRDLGIITGQTGPVMDKLRASLGETELGQKKLADLTKSGLINSEEDLFKALDKVNPALALGAGNATEYGVKAGLLGNQFFDASGKIKSMADVADVLKTSLAGMSQEEELATLRTLFGTDAIRAASVLAKEGAAGFDEMAAAMGKVSASAVGAEKLNNLAGSVEQLKGSLETMGITIGIQLLPILKDFVDALTQAANDAMPAMEQAAKDVAAAFVAWMPTLKALAGFLWDNRDAIAAVAAALATFVILTTVVGWITTLVTVISAVSAAISASGGILAALGALVALLGGPVTLIIAAVALAVGALAYAWINDWGGIQEKTAAVVDWLAGVPDTVSGYWDAITSATDALVTGVADGWAALVQATSDAWDAIGQATSDAWDAIASFLTDWWREILVALTGPIGLLAVFIIDHWEQIQTATETIFRAIANLLTAIWGEIYTQIIQPKLDAISTAVSDAWTAISTTTTELLSAFLAYVRDTIFEPLRAAIAEKIAAAQTAISDAWTAIATRTTEALNAFLAYVRDTIFEPLRAAIAEKIAAVETAVGAVWDAISTKAHEVLDPVLAYVRDTIFEPIKTAVETAMTGATTAFTDAVNGFKTTVDTVMSGVHTAWMTMWGAIETAAKSPADALRVVTEAVGKLKEAMPEWLIPHSPTPFQIGLEGIAQAADKASRRITQFYTATGDVPGELDDWLNAAIAATGVGGDWLSGLRWIAMHESTGDPHAVNPTAVNGQHAAGLMQTMPSTFGAYALSGMHDIFNPVDNAAAAIRYIQKAYGGDLGYIIENWARRGGYAAGGWAGLHGPELAWLGERGPEYVVPNAALNGSGSMSGATQHITIDVAIGGAVAEQIYVTGRDLAVRRGRGTTGVGSLAGPLSIGSSA